MSTFTHNPVRDAAPTAAREQSRIFRGRTTDELIPKIVAELGSEAIVLRHHKGLAGGFAGFFQRPFVEIEACRGGGQMLDRYDEDDASPALPGRYEDDDAPAQPARYEHNATFAQPERYEHDATLAQPERYEHNAAIAQPERYEHDATPAPLERHEDDQAPGEADTWASNPFAAALAEAEAAVRAAEPAVPPDLDAALATALADAEAAGLRVEPAIRTAHDVTLAAALAEAEAEAEAEIAAAEAQAEAEAAEAEAAEAEAAAEAAESRAEPAPPDRDPALAHTTSFSEVAPLDSPPPTAAPTSHGRTEDAVERATFARTLFEVGFDEQFAGEALDAAAAHLLPLLVETETRAPSPPSSPSSSGFAQAVRRALQQRIPTCPPLPPGPATIAFVGPGGSGKSACCDTLLDAYRRRSTLPAERAALVAGADGTPAVAFDPHFPEPVPIDDPGAAHALRRARDEGLLLLDTPPLSPADPASIDALATTLEQLAPDRVVLALPATLGAKPAARLLAAYRPLGIGALAITHTDETDQLGVAVQVACALGLPPAYLLERGGSGWSLAQIDPADLVERLLPPP